jgi:hypothetical protein
MVKVKCKNLCEYNPIEMVKKCTFKKKKKPPYEKYNSTKGFLLYFFLGGYLTT